MMSAVNAYLDNLPDPWARNTAEAIINMIRRSGALDESIKWGHPFFSLHRRAVVKIYTARDWIDVFFYRGGALADPDGLLGAKGRSSMRRLQLPRDHAVPGGLQELIRQAVAVAEPSGHNETN